LRFAVTVLWPLLALMTRRDWRQARRVPAEGGVIVVANHISNADPGTLGWFLLYGAGRIPRFLAKASLWDVPLFGRVVRGSGMIPVRRNTADAALALTPAIEAVRRGECVVIYPEGSTTKDPDLWPMQARTGVARLALATGAPVVPVAQWGAHLLLSKTDGFHPLRRPVCTTLAGEPLDLSAYAGREPTGPVLREVTDVIMGRVRQLVGELRGEQPPAVVFTPQAPSDEV
jgi:1-acyl-sn-glycerol-3-phosphate acyltransferase